MDVRAEQRWSHRHDAGPHADGARRARRARDDAGGRRQLLIGSAAAGRRRSAGVVHRGRGRASEGDVFHLDVIADSDTTDILVALGLNSLFQGVDASTIQVLESIQSDPTQLAASASGAVGDSGALRSMLDLQNTDVEGLGGSFGEFYSTLVGGIGFEISSTRSAAEVEAFLVESLEERRQSIAGVNVDESLVNMLAFEQALKPAAQFMQVVNQMQDEVLRLV